MIGVLDSGAGAHGWQATPSNGTADHAIDGRANEMYSHSRWFCQSAAAFLHCRGECPGSTVLTIFGAGTLAVPFRQLDAVFEQQHPGVTVHSEFGSSVMMARRIKDLHQPVDLLGVADYHVIPQYMFEQDNLPRHATGYVGFAGNAITFAYTDESKYSKDVTSQNWYKVLAPPGVEIGRSNPDAVGRAIRRCRCGLWRKNPMRSPPSRLAFSPMHPFPICATLPKATHDAFDCFYVFDREPV